ncbi:MAG: GntR family transcriptional regulator [Propionibacteriaceae bacterium]|jgi:DNA-binding FadR family transcriptional regulator|nr:GntR family transcriptional regulator [Propionibacteriaceae bacterium]
MADAARGSAMARTTLASLRQKIVSGEWPINSRIPKEPELMELFGVGKSTVREAVRSLANLGMLETIRGVGTFVRSRAPVSSVLTEYLGDYDIGQMLAYRRALEIEAAQLAAVHSTAEQVERLRRAHELERRPDPTRPQTIERGTTPGAFHHLVFEAAGVELMAVLYSGLMTAIRTAARRDGVVRRADDDSRQREHQAVLVAIEAGDPLGAAQAMALHVDHDMRADGPGFDPAAVTARSQAILAGAPVSRPP